MTKTGTRPVFVFGGKEFSNFRFRSLFTKIRVAKLQQLFQSTKFFRKKREPHISARLSVIPIQCEIELLTCDANASTKQTKIP